MPFRDGQSVRAPDLAFKAYEIEELVDIYFFRRFGFLVARFAAALRFTPTQVTVFGALVGIAGGAMLYDPRLGLYAFALLILHGIIDSADGQLARMTKQMTELGRVLDGGAGYLTHVAIYFAIAAGVMHRGGSSSILVWMLLAGIANAMQSQMYDYHRGAYIAVVLEARVPGNEPANVPSWLRWLYCGYLMMQRWLIGWHARVESTLAARSVAGRVREDDRLRYRECFYRPVRGWNSLGDNGRRFAIGVLVCFNRPDLFLAFILLPMNAVLIALWFWQRHADRKFLASL